MYGISFWVKNKYFFWHKSINRYVFEGKKIHNGNETYNTLYRWADIFFKIINCNIFAMLK